MDFAGKVVIVTGSSAGIGQATAVMFARENAAGIVIHGQNAERLNATYEAILKIEGVDSSRVLQVLGSMEAEATPKRIHDEAVKRFGRIDVLVNNAGALMKPGCTDPHDLACLDYLYRVNFRSVVELTQLCMPELVESKGNVVNVSSVAGIRAYPISNSYACMKAALDHFTRTYAMLYGPKGVRINSLNPGPVLTSIYERIGVSDAQMDTVVKLVEGQTLLKRWGTSGEMAKCIKFLASNDAAYVTGTSLVADGGWIHYGWPSQLS